MDKNTIFAYKVEPCMSIDGRKIIKVEKHNDKYYIEHQEEDYDEYYEKREYQTIYIQEINEDQVKTIKQIINSHPILSSCPTQLSDHSIMDGSYHEITLNTGKVRKKVCGCNITTLKFNEESLEVFIKHMTLKMESKKEDIGQIIEDLYMLEISRTVSQILEYIELLESEKENG